MADHDYIIIGSGAAGSVLANRLTEDPSNRVLLIEAGGSDRNPMILVPKAFFFTMTDPKYAKTYTTEPFGKEGVVDHWTRGKMLGGSTGINGMVWNRGWAPDYDVLEQRGNPGWNWDAFLSAYRTIEDHQLGASELRGQGGPVGVSIAVEKEAVAEKFIGALESRGISRVEDLNGSDDERIGYVPSSVKNGFRVSAAESYLHPIKHRPNLTLLTHTQAGYLLYDGNRVVGVRTSRNGVTQDFHANKEVIASMGSLETPLFLERSGIGKPEVLSAAGVKVKVESPNVGERMLEHRGTSMQFRLKDGLGYNHRLSSLPRQLATGAKYLLSRDGVMSVGGYDLVGFVKSKEEQERPDTQLMFTPISTKGASLTSGKVAVDDKAGAMFLGYALRPTSEGSIHIGGALPENAPIIRPNFFATEHDQKSVIALTRTMRELIATGPISDVVVEETLPGRDIDSDEEILRNAFLNGGNGYHTLGTCAMGPEDDDVVDSRLRVRGVEGLRVVDASVFPTMPSGNNNAPTQAAAWLAADLILEDHS